MRFLVGVTLISLVACNGNGHVTQQPFTVKAGDDVVNCACNLSFNNSSCTSGTCQEHFNVQLCLPQSLQQVSVPDGGADTYAQAVDQYCRDVVTLTVYHLITVFNGSWCDYKAPFAPDGGVGSSVSCFAQPFDGRMSATATDDGTCRTPCPAVECDYNTNCGKGVQDTLGNVDLNKCQCSQITTRECPGDPASDLPRPLFCRPPQNVSLN